MNMEHGSESLAPLLKDEDHDSSLKNPNNTFLIPDEQVWKRLMPWLIHGSIMLAYSLLIFVVLSLGTLRSGTYTCNNQKQVQPLLPPLPLPAREGLQWEYRHFPTELVDNPFAGPPRAEMEDAWHNLLKNDNIRVPVAYLQEKNLTSVYTKDHAEGIASLSVYHSLHCLKKIKHMMFKEHYHSGLDSAAMARQSKHADHCVEYIRESLMCQPDLSLVTFRWINETAQHEDLAEFYPTNFDADLHYCADWEGLDTWAGGRVFDLFRVELLDRPRLGKSVSRP